MDEPLIGLHVKLPASLYERLETYWHEHRLHSRSEAVREAIERLLDAEDLRTARKSQRP